MISVVALSMVATGGCIGFNDAEKESIFSWMGKEGGLSITHWHRDNMVYLHKFDEFCIKLTFHFSIVGAGI